MREGEGQPLQKICCPAIEYQILLYYYRSQAPIPSPWFRHKMSHPSELLPSVTTPPGLQQAPPPPRRQYYVDIPSPAPQPQLASAGLRFLVIGQQTFAGERSGSVESGDTVGAGLSQTHIFAGILQLMFISCAPGVTAACCMPVLVPGPLHSLVQVRWICCPVPVF